MMTQYGAILDPVIMTQPQINIDESSAETVSPVLTTGKSLNNRKTTKVQI